MSKVVVYGDISLDAIDGSSIWLASISEVLSSLFDEVHLQLKLNPHSETLIGALRDLPNLTIHPNRFVDGQETDELETDDALTPQEASITLERLVLETSPDAVVARGFEVCHQLSQNTHVAPILWSYITDLPYPVTQLSKNSVTRLRRIAYRSHRMLAQTEAARSYLEAVAPEAAGKTALLPPMIPDGAFNTGAGMDGSTYQGGRLELVYSGKLARDWRTLEMLELPAYLRDLGVNAQLTIIGSKYMHSRNHPEWLHQMREALQEVRQGLRYNVRWLGGLDRKAAIGVMANSHMGIGWRTEALDSSLEVSTKALEYSAVGLPSVINRSVDHLALFGENYPFFVGGTSSVRQVAHVIAQNLDRINEHKQKLTSIASRFSFSSAKEHLKTVFNRGGAFRRPSHAPNNTGKLAIVSHDFKFMGELMDALDNDSRVDVRVDGWKSLHRHDVSQSESTAAWADTVLCEWAGPAAKWYSHHKREASRLLVRLHAFELRGPWIRDINWEAVDQVIFVSELYRRKAIEQLKLDPAKTTVIPNAIDTEDFNRPKTAGAEFNLALVGMVGFGKRPDRAIEALAHLLEIDRRYRLYIKGRPPWEYPYEWDQPVQRQLYLEFFNRIQKNERLREAVVFEGFTPDIASWLRKIGWVLSPSAYESFHMAPAEGMASASVPVLWDREGVDEIFSGIDIVPDSRAAAAYIAEINAKGNWRLVGRTSQDYAQRWDTQTVLSKWEEVLF